jgi:CheY-like chemotaxis protein
MRTPEDPSARVVLIAEDDSADRRVATRVLRTAGYQVVEADDGLKAWAQFERDPSRFSALVADVVMPRMPGTELAARVHAVRPSMPVLLMTGYTRRPICSRRDLWRFMTGYWPSRSATRCCSRSFVRRPRCRTLGRLTSATSRRDRRSPAGAGADVTPRSRRAAAAALPAAPRSGPA